MKKLLFIKKYIKYIIKSKGLHGVHSPFVFNFLEKVLYHTNMECPANNIENQRKHFLNNPQKLNITDLGAGSLQGSSNVRTIQSIAKHAAKPPKFGQLFYRIIKYYNYQNILELGTSLGMSTAYMALAAPNAQIQTIEGCPNIAEKAAEHLGKYSNIKQWVGNFDEVLPPLLKNNQKDFDFIFIDGNHRKTPTINYFEWCLPHLSKDSMIILDDIHWSEEMEQAWHEVQKNPKVGISIDLFYIGILFIKPVKQQEHFVIKF